MSCFLYLKYSAARIYPRTSPFTINCEPLLSVGFKSIGFINTEGSVHAAAACIACAVPISSPSPVICELSAIFCDLNGAVFSPSCLKIRHSAAVIKLLPAFDIVPCIIIGLATNITQFLYQYSVFGAGFDCNSVKTFVQTAEICAGTYEYTSL